MIIFPLTFILHKQGFLVFIFCQYSIQIYNFLVIICFARKLIFIANSQKSTNNDD